jgi:hypothetical protein
MLVRLHGCRISSDLLEGIISQQTSCFSGLYGLADPSSVMTPEPKVQELSCRYISRTGLYNSAFQLAVVQQWFPYVTKRHFFDEG